MKNLFILISVILILVIFAGCNLFVTEEPGYDEYAYSIVRTVETYDGDWNWIASFQFSQSITEYTPYGGADEKDDYYSYIKMSIMNRTDFTIWLEPLEVTFYPYETYIYPSTDVIYPIGSGWNYLINYRIYDPYFRIDDATIIIGFDYWISLIESLSVESLGEAVRSAVIGESDY